jgi:hypothetical protein
LRGTPLVVEFRTRGNPYARRLAAKKR